MIGYSRDMQRYVGCAGCNQGVGGILDWIGQIFAPGLTAAERMAKDIQAAEAAKAAAAQAAAAQPTAEMQQRLAAAEAALEQLKLQQRSTEVIRPPTPTAAAGVNWLALAAVGVGAYFIFRKKPRRRAGATSRRRMPRRRRRR